MKRGWHEGSVARVCDGIAVTPRSRGTSRRRRRSERPRGLVGQETAGWLPNRPLLVAASVGMGISGYITVVHWLDTSVAGCARGSGCDLVQASPFALLLGIPVAAWGLLLYAALTVIAVSVRDTRLSSRLALAVSMALRGATRARSKGRSSAMQLRSSPTSSANRRGAVVSRRLRAAWSASPGTPPGSSPGIATRGCWRSIGWPRFPSSRGPSQLDRRAGMPV
jgi:hypothetical protein